MKDLTDEEYEVLNKYYAKHLPDVDTSKNNGFAAKSLKVVPVDDKAAKWLMVRALETDKSTVEIINELIQKEMAGAY